MKKLLLASLFVVLAGVSLYAANQYNWGTSNGNSWQTPNDATVTPNQFLVIGATDSVNPIVKAVSEPILYSRTLAQILATVPDAAGQLVVCSNCTNAAICVSTGTGTGAFVLATSTGSAFITCK